MTVGRKPKPAKLKILEGNRGKRPIPPEPEPLRELRLEDAPAHLGPEALEVWRRELPLVPRGVLAVHHAELFGNYCVLIAQLARCAKLVEQAEPFTKTKSGQFVFSPAGASLLRYLDVARKMASELGLTPTSAPRVAIERAGAISNPFEKFRRA